MAVERIFLVVGSGLILAAYRGPRGPELAGQHSRCLLGATVVPCDLLEALPAEIREDLYSEWDRDEDDSTPVTTVPIEEIDDKSEK